MMTFKQSLLKSKTDKALSDLTNILNSYQEENEVLSEKVLEYENNINADARVAELSARIEELERDVRRGFAISAEELKAIDSWKVQHNKKMHKTKKTIGAIGGQFQYIFCPTSIGDVGYVQCLCCQKRALVESNGNSTILNKLVKEYDSEFVFQDLI